MHGGFRLSARLGNIRAIIFPGHATVDLSLAKTFAETLSLTAVNLANRRGQLDNRLTFGGFHWQDPRPI
jgi:hypothetical protein